MLTFFVPMRTISEANSRDHWRKKAARVKRQRAAVSAVAWSAMPGAKVKAELPVIVTLTRVSPRLLDDDNWVSSAKGQRDAIAEWIGVDDRKSDLVRYEYAQIKGRPMGVIVAVRKVV